MSDLHLEFTKYDMDDPDVHGDVLVLAGDITIKNRVAWINNQATRFRHIIYVLGNHEFYRGDLYRTVEKTRDALFSNVHLLQNESVTLNGKTFHGGTLWTDFENGNPLKMHLVGGALNDFKLIRMNKYSLRFRPEDALREHKQTKAFLAENVKPGDVVVTHHAPSWMSIATHFKNDLYNSGFASDLSDLILETRPSVWIHGHLHNASDYQIGDTTVLCNPRGYVGHETMETWHDYAMTVV